MGSKDQILISLAQRHATNIFSGVKRVELRRRQMRVAPGTTVWIYVKIPVGSIIGRARIKAVHSSSPAALWRRFGAVSGLSRKEFFEYFDGTTTGYALELTNTQQLRSSLPLDMLRAFASEFQPPQFFTRIGAQHPLRAAIASAA